MAFARISFILPSNEALGPLHISLGRTINELYKWFFLFLMIFLAFLLGLFKLYSNYGGEELGINFVFCETIDSISDKNWLLNFIVKNTALKKG